MNLKKSLTTLALGLTLATGLVGTHGMAPAHASSGRGGPIIIGFPGPIVISPSPLPQVSVPTITAYGRYGTAYVSGTGFNPNSQLTVNFWVPGSPVLEDVGILTDAKGAFSMSWRTLSGCINNVVQVEALDNLTFAWADTTVVPGCFS